jgi:hypothetical protein
MTQRSIQARDYIVAWVAFAVSVAIASSLAMFAIPKAAFALLAAAGAHSSVIFYLGVTLVTWAVIALFSLGVFWLVVDRLIVRSVVGRSDSEAHGGVPDRVEPLT